MKFAWSGSEKADKRKQVFIIVALLFIIIVFRILDMDLYAVDTESYFVKDIKIINNQLSFSVYIPRSDMSITNFSYYFSDKSIYIRLKCCHVCLCDLTNGELRVSINLPEGFTYKLYKKGRSNCDIQLIDEIAL